MGIPARYREGYCIPNSLMKKSAVELDVDGSEWFMGENSYNPENKMYSVEVTDYYAHAWIEVYLENKGFVPFEVTPSVYTSERPDPEMPDIVTVLPQTSSEEA